jgi:hypothetical protein
MHLLHHVLRHITMIPHSLTVKHNRSHSTSSCRLLLLLLLHTIHLSLLRPRQHPHQLCLLRSEVAIIVHLSCGSGLV